MGCIGRIPVFGHILIVCAVADIEKSPLVDAPVGFAQSEDHSFLRKRCGKAKALRKGETAKGQRICTKRDRGRDRFCLKRCAVTIFLNHDYLILPQTAVACWC